LNIELSEKILSDAICRICPHRLVEDGEVVDFPCDLEYQPAYCSADFRYDIYEWMDKNDISEKELNDEYRHKSIIL
jgi:hypothetical protein